MIAALIPTDALPALARFRTAGDVRIVLSGASAWLTCDSDRPELQSLLRTVAGAVFYRRVGDTWTADGRRLPDRGLPPAGEALPLDRLIVPDRIAVRSRTESDRNSRIAVRLTPSPNATDCTAVLVDLGAVSDWVDRAPEVELRRFRGAIADNRSLLLLGLQPPHFPEGRRYWGDRILVPLGMQLDLPGAESWLMREYGTSHLVIIDGSFVHHVPWSAFEMVTRSGLREAIGMSITSAGG